MLRRLKRVSRNSSSPTSTLERLQASYLKAGELLVVCPAGLGDTFFICSLLQPVLKKRGFSRAVVLTKPNQLFIGQMFDEFIDAHLIPGWLDINQLKNVLPLPENIIYGHFQTDEAVNLLGFKGITLLDSHRALLGLPLDQKLTAAKPISETERQTAREFLANSKIGPKHFVILAPDAVSLTNISLDFWVKLSQRLRDKGLKVVLNGQGEYQAKIAHDANSFDIEPSSLRALAEEAARIISIRSGLCDILTTTRSALTVIYPDIKWHGGTMLEATSLVTMGVGKHVREVEFGTIDKTISVVMKDLA